MGNYKIFPSGTVLARFATLAATAIHGSMTEFLQQIRTRKQLGFVYPEVASFELR